MSWASPRPKAASRPRAPAFRSIRAASTPRCRSSRSRRVVSVVRRLGGGAQGTVRGLCRGQAEAERPRLRRPAALLGADGRRAGLADDIGGRFDHVLVDEYQDTNRLQSSILLALKPGGRGLTVVGDDAQSIYSFRAATVRNILDFPGQFSPAGAASSRSTATIARRSRSLPPRTASSVSPRSASPRTSGPSAPPPRSRSSSRCATKPIRRASSSSGFWRTARPAPASRSRPCCSAPPATARRWKSN